MMVPIISRVRCTVSNGACAAVGGVGGVAGFAPDWAAGAVLGWVCALAASRELRHAHDNTDKSAHASGAAIADRDEAARAVRMRGSVHERRSACASRMIDDSTRAASMSHRPIKTTAPLRPSSLACASRRLLSFCATFRAGLALALCCALLASEPVRAVGERTAVQLKMVDYSGGNPTPRPNAATRLAWEVRQRTSVETKLEAGRVRFSDPAVFDTPLLYFSGDRAFPLFSEAEVQGFRRFVDFGGAVIIDDAAPEESGFDASVRREIARAFGGQALVRLRSSHVLFRSFFLVQRPVGRVAGPDYLEAVERGGRAAVIYSRHDLGGAYERDNLGNYTYAVAPGAERQREMAFRLGVNLVLYALCLDYKDDQVHAPFIMRRWAGRP
jgi:hypothetical protein